MKDGWHVLCGYHVYIEDGKVLRGVKCGSGGYNSTYPYRYNRRYGCWTNESGVTVAAFRAAVKRGNMMMS